MLNGPLWSAVVPVPEIDTTVACQSSYTQVFASGGSFPDVCGELIGVGQNRPVQRPPLSLTFCGECDGCSWLSKKWKSRRKSQKQQNFHAADDRRRAAGKKSGQSASNLWGHFAMHCWWNNGFSRSKNKNKRLEQTDESWMWTESRT